MNTQKVFIGDTINYNVIPGNSLLGLIPKSGIAASVVATAYSNEHFMFFVELTENQILAIEKADWQLGFPLAKISKAGIDKINLISSDIILNDKYDSGKEKLYVYLSEDLLVDVIGPSQSGFELTTQNQEIRNSYFYKKVNQIDIKDPEGNYILFGPDSAYIEQNKCLYKIVGYSAKNNKYLLHNLVRPEGEALNIDHLKEIDYLCLKDWLAKPIVSLMSLTDFKSINFYY